MPRQFKLALLQIKAAAAVAEAVTTPSLTHLKYTIQIEVVVVVVLTKAL
jgi:putative ubiquitin-RnfH superfamily antitoxin RatB of RatAB toxin-antitoxin module